MNAIYQYRKHSFTSQRLPSNLVTQQSRFLVDFKSFLSKKKYLKRMAYYFFYRLLDIVAIFRRIYTLMVFVVHLKVSRNFEPLTFSKQCSRVAKIASNAINHFSFKTTLRLPKCKMQKSSRKDSSS